MSTSTERTEAIQVTEHNIRTLEYWLSQTSDETIADDFKQRIYFAENKLSNLRFTDRDSYEPDQSIGDETETYLSDERNSIDTWIQGEYGHINLTLTRRQHARTINVWRDRSNNLMVGRMRISFTSTGRPTATCTHCGLAFTAVANNIVTAECFTIACIAHGHNDGPLFARAYTIAELTHYKPIKSRNLPIALLRKINRGALAKQALTPSITYRATLGAIVDNGQMARLTK